MAVAPGWPVVGLLALLLLGPLLVGWLVGDVIATSLNLRDHLRAEVRGTLGPRERAGVPHQREEPHG